MTTKAQWLVDIAALEFQCAELAGRARAEQAWCHAAFAGELREVARRWGERAELLPDRISGGNEPAGIMKGA